RLSRAPAVTPGPQWPSLGSVQAVHGDAKIFMKILFIGDTVGKAGRAIVRQYLESLQQEYEADLTILNCENAAAGFGITQKIAEEIFDWGIDIITSWNHIWIKK